MAKNTVECPACSHSWLATEADLGLRIWQSRPCKCPTCGAALKVTRVPIAWSYEAVEVTAVKADEATEPS